MSAPFYWRDKIIRYRLVASKCKSCGTIHFPPKKICKKCRSKDMEEVELPRSGKLLTFSIVRYPPEEFVEYAPYAVGVVELENGVRVLAQITDADVEELRTGIEVEMVVRKIKDLGERDIIVYGYKFRPALKRSSSS